VTSLPHNQMTFCRDRLWARAASILLAASVVGCAPTPSAPKKSSQEPATSSSRRNERVDVLFTTVVEQLRDLSSYVDVDLTPPTVVLDAKSSADHHDVMAICGMAPNVEEGPINCIMTTTHNGRFRSLGVQPGDMLKYFVLYDEESAETGISQTVSLDLTVAQVLDENTLLFEGGLQIPITEPAKIEIWHYSDERLEDIARALALYVRFREPVRFPQPKFDWEPSPDSRVLKQMTERLNQWMRLSNPQVKWTADALVSTIDPELAKDDRLAPLITPKALADNAIQPHEGRLLQEAVWLRDIGRWTQGDSFDDVARATALFDWIVRNVQLDADAEAKPYRPWETLVFGHGTAEQRAWVFALMARQLGLDVVVLDVPAGEEGKSQFWLTALLSDGKVYLFDPRLGLPIPGKDGKGVATLADLQADTALLRKLDLDDTKYPVTEEQLQHVMARVVADPFDLSRRAAAIETKLSGDDRLALSVSPTAIGEKLKSVPGVESVALWNFPFRTIRDQLRIPIEERRELAMEFEPFAWRPTLWKARVLHFQGHEKGDIDSPTADPDEVVNDHREAIGLYASPQVRPPDRLLKSLGSEPKIKIYAAAKDAASQWVGLLLYDEGEFDSAKDWLSEPRLKSRDGGPWADGARYNLGRTLEALGRADEAAKLYEADTSPQRYGNRLRARMIQQKASGTAPAADSSDDATDSASASANDEG
jgi:tetratricopeptide (TPR) repeat protein